LKAHSVSVQHRAEMAGLRGTQHQCAALGGNGRPWRYTAPVCDAGQRWQVLETHSAGMQRQAEMVGLEGTQCQCAASGGDGRPERHPVPVYDAEQR
jgi:hypothetical protein